MLAPAARALAGIAKPAAVIAILHVSPAQPSVCERARAPLTSASHHQRLRPFDISHEKESSSFEGKVFFRKSLFHSNLPSLSSSSHLVTQRIPPITRAARRSRRSRRDAFATIDALALAGARQARGGRKRTCARALNGHLTHVDAPSQPRRRPVRRLLRNLQSVTLEGEEERKLSANMRE